MFFNKKGKIERRFLPIISAKLGDDGHGKQYFDAIYQELQSEMQIASEVEKMGEFGSFNDEEILQLVTKRSMSHLVHLHELMQLGKEMEVRKLQSLLFGRSSLNHRSFQIMTAKILIDYIMKADFFSQEFIDNFSSFLQTKTYLNDSGLEVMDTLIPAEVKAKVLHFRPYW